MDSNEVDSTKSKELGDLTQQLAPIFQVKMGMILLNRKRIIVKGLGA
jgi:hypothetical protein